MTYTVQALSVKQGILSKHIKFVNHIDYYTTRDIWYIAVGDAYLADKLGHG